jgi:tumor protein p53-inducible protein 3
MALLSGGGNAEFVAVNENHLIKIPESMSFKKASAIPEV